MSNYSKIDNGQRKYQLIFWVILSLILTTSLALAAVRVSPAEVIFSANYNDFEDEDQSTIKERVDIPIQNTETNPITVAVSVLGLPSRYNVPAINPVNIPAGETRTVNMEINIPHLQDSGKRQIGTIEVRDTTTSNLYHNVGLIQDTKPMLAIDEITVKYYDSQGESETQTFSGNDKKLQLDESVQPGSQVKINFLRIENLFNNDYDSDKSDIEDILLKIEVDDDDLYQENFEEEYELGGLGAEKEEDFEVSFIIDEEAEDKEYSLQIELEGEDGEGAKHTVIKEFKIKLKRSKDDVRITEFKISPETIKACSQTATLNADLKIKNLGTSRQDRVEIQLFSDSLAINQVISNIKLDKFSKEDNEFSRTLNLNIDPEEIAPGRHEIDLNVYIDHDELQNHRRLAINVESCSDNQNAEILENANTVTAEADLSDRNNRTNQLSAEVNSLVTSGRIVQVTEDPYSSEDVLVSLIIISIILLLAVIAIFIVILIKK